MQGYQLFLRPERILGFINSSNLVFRIGQPQCSCLTKHFSFIFAFGINSIWIIANCNSDVHQGSPVVHNTPNEREDTGHKLRKQGCPDSDKVCFLLHRLLLEDSPFPHRECLHHAGHNWQELLLMRKRFFLSDVEEYSPICSISWDDSALYFDGYTAHRLDLLHDRVCPHHKHISLQTITAFSFIRHAHLRYCQLSSRMGLHGVFLEKC